VPNDSIIDVVCGKKVNLSESYDYKTAGRVYHFHSHACKLTFKMNSEKFINNKCAPIN
jgi:YHS domain-containing protein